jgi:hypothetical protein
VRCGIAPIDAGMTHTPPAGTIRTWLTMPEAAALLGKSVRTLERAIARGEYQVQHTPDGRRLVDMTEETAARHADVHALQEAGQEARQQAVALAAAVAHMTQAHQQHLAGMEMQLRSEREAAVHVRGELEGARRSLRRYAWAGVAAACAVAGLCVSLTYTLQEAQEQGATLRHLRVTLSQAEARATAAEAAADAARASEAATRREALTHTRSWWWQAPTQARGGT